MISGAIFIVIISIIMLGAVLAVVAIFFTHEIVQLYKKNGMAAFNDEINSMLIGMTALLWMEVLVMVAGAFMLVGL